MPTVMSVTMDILATFILIILCGLMALGIMLIVEYRRSNKENKEDENASESL
jgi:heme/copper-type cytochrome/quinol oxidase subunit 2